MVTPTEIGFLALVLAILIGVFVLVRAIKPLIVNAVVGLIVLLLAGWLGYGVVITPIVILIVAFGGLPAALIVIILAQLDIIFEPALLLPLL